MKTILILLLLAVLSFTGCDDQFAKKSRPGGNPAAPSPATDPASANKPANPEKRTLKKADILAVNKAIDSFYVQEGRFPKDLEELVERGVLPRIPLLPEGSTWDYDTNLGTARVIKL